MFRMNARVGCIGEGLLHGGSPTGLLLGRPGNPGQLGRQRRRVPGTERHRGPRILHLALRQSDSRDLKNLTPRTRVNRTCGYDLNFHCPKSVSMVHAWTGDERIIEAFL